ncbi:MAG: hypothetical protein ACPG77_19865 [Nannocystaceae bacterium]
MFDFPNFDAAPPEALDLWTWYHLVCSAGCLLWIAAYVAFAVKAQRDRIPGIPTIAMCLNFAWEATYTILPNFNPWWPALNLGWLGLDCFLMWQLFRFGPGAQRHEILAKTFRYWVPVLVLLAAWGQLSFVMTYRDRLALVDAFFINLVMSALFIWTFFERPKQRGLSLLGAVLKLLGTLGTAIGAHVFLPLMNPEVEHWNYLTFLCATILLLDVVYVSLLYNARKKARLDTSVHEA